MLKRRCFAVRKLSHGSVLSELRGALSGRTISSTLLPIEHSPADVVRAARSCVTWLAPATHGRGVHKGTATDFGSLHYQAAAAA